MAPYGIGLKIIKQGVLPFALLLLISCGSDKESVNQFLGPTPVNESASPGSCTNQPTDGLDIPTLGGDQDLQSSGYFGKHLPLNQLENSLQASSLSIAKALVNENVRLFHVVERQKSRCQYFSFLQPAQGAALERWNNFSKGGRGITTLLGLFTTVYSQQGGGPVQLINPTILVRHDTQKWTLIHEMTHYLFAKGRVRQNGVPLKSQINSDVEELQRNIRRATMDYMRRPAPPTAQRLANLWRALFEANFAIDKREALEEFTIEALLFERGVNGRISNIDQAQNLNSSIGYMLRNANLVRRTYELMQNRLDRLQINFRRNNNLRAAEKLRAVESDLEGVLQILSQTTIRFQNMLQGRLGSAFNPDEQPQKMPTLHFDVEGLKIRQQLIEEL